MTLGLLAGSVTTANSAAADSGCPSTSAPPQSGSVYQVSTPGHLQWIKDANVSGSNAQWTYDYVQTADIDMTGCTWTSSIGDGSPDFVGAYDGQGFTIRGLALGTGSLGVFGRVDATLTGINLRDVTMNITDDNPGLLASALLRGSISDSSATGSISANANIGGLVGNNYATIEDSWANVTIVGTSSAAGGLAGFNGNGAGAPGTIRRSFATGSVTASRSVGGLVGVNYGSSSIEASYAQGRVTSGTNQAGGLAGRNDGTVSNSYSTGLVTAGSDPYGFVGNVSSGGTYSANFWDTDTSGQSSPGLGGSEATGKTTAQMTTVSTFSDANWSIANGYSTSTTWGICPEANDGYPFLVSTQSSNPCTTDPQAAAAEFTYLLPDGRECTSISPERVIIGTVHQLPGREALCQTSDGSLVAGWVIPVPEGFTGAGSSANPFSPGHQVFVSDSQQFTLVPYEQVLTITYDANVAIGHDCKPNDVTHASANGHHQSIWVPRTDFAMARTPSIAPCTPMGHMLTGWNTAGDGSGDALSLGAELPESWATRNSNAHTLYAVWEASTAAD